MTKAHSTARPLPVLPPPHLVGARPYLPPLESLHPSPQPQFFPGAFPPGSLPERSHAAYVSPPPFTPSLAQGVAPPPPQTYPVYPGPVSSFPPVGQSGPVTSFSHPALYPQKASFQSKNPGTVYEALSPVEYSQQSPYDLGTPQSVFRETSYPQNPYQPAPVRPLQSSTGSHQSSEAPSSSGHASLGSTRPYSHTSSPFASTGLLGPGGQQQETNDMQDRYILTIRQQPIAARACGFGERDRRVIDPPPIVQLSLKDFDPASPADVHDLQYPWNIMHCALLSASSADVAQRQPTSSPVYPPTPSADVTTVPDPHSADRVTRRLMGTLVYSPFVGTDPDFATSGTQAANVGVFFIFSDLSCRQNGLYRLRFTLMKVPVGPDLSEATPGSVRGSIDSDVFEVFSAKDFPGMRESSRLIKDLKRQGASVSVRKGKSGIAGLEAEREREKRASSVSGSGEEDEEDAGVKGRTRAKKRRA
ncbi:uncharacterized protein KY384_003075 [Bacidia gigantensis]|uniref:uncharacterized protein n=1 Tax=Bacidia gigantensis TaxID=2732470 RepID=UPI001D04035C|nr:uncharacterized protein KY384_003075 [Bacidia gigantensis]KAG8531446.1 hypothetical protein KY384_003075 [Bacidia gigantensis]